MCGCGISSIIDSSGLNFTMRISFNSRGSFSDGLFEYYARTASPLRSDNITVVFSANTWRHGIQVLAIHRANTLDIFDSNPTMPAMVSCIGVQLLPCSASIDTSTMDFVVAGTTIADAGPCGVVQGVGGVPGFTTITTNNGYGGWFEIDYTMTTNSHSNIVFNCDDTDPTAILMDAISLRGAMAPARLHQ